jgi:alkanesulfonate monooxygenase SsuD/methylene tetrahydromethanopterin reductase-like flavin-dependent oxidoreductase (luciferase family)
VIGAGLRMLVVGAEIGGLGAALPATRPERCVLWACADGGGTSSMPSTCGGSHAGVMNTSSPIRRGLGISAGLDAGLARDLAVRCEQLGYHSLWSNDEPASPGLEMLAHFAAAAPQLQLGVGVLPLDRHQPVRIAAEIARLGLDPARLWIGVGSGQLRAPIQLVRRAVAELRELLPEGTRIVLTAMRPRMCHLGGAIADAVLLNWMLPAHTRPGAPPGVAGSRPGGTRSPGRRVLCPRRRGRRRRAAAPRRGAPLPQHQ